MRGPHSMFEIKDVDLAGRIGRLTTKSGTIETPAFFPVIDILRQEVSPAEIKEVGFDQVITNAYLTLRRFGEEAVEKGIHNVLGFDGVVMTDSGAYQILEYGRIRVGQDEIIRYQDSIGSDIAVILDIPTGDVPREKAEESVRITLERARQAIEAIKDTKPLWVLPVQGGRYLDLIRKSAREAKELFEHYQLAGIGSPTVFMEKYRYRIVTDMIAAAKEELPGGKPVHLFGAGHPIIITLASALGVDTFDSASYIIYARDDRYMTEYGVERLERLDYFPCECPVCTRYTPSQLREMPKRERTRLLALHNLYVIKKAIDRVKQSIREGRLWELIEETAAKHPRAYEAFRGFRRYSPALLAKSTPRAKGVVRGMRFYRSESAWNPRILLFRGKVEKYLREAGVRNAILAPYPVSAEECPRGAPLGDPARLYYVPYLGLVPEPLCGVYPTIHFDYPSDDPPEDVLDELVSYVVGAVGRLGLHIVEIRGGDGWRRRVAERLMAALTS